MCTGTFCIYVQNAAICATLVSGICLHTLGKKESLTSSPFRCL